MAIILFLKVLISNKSIGNFSVFFISRGGGYYRIKREENFVLPGLLTLEEHPKVVLASQVLQVPAWVDLQVLEAAPLAHLEPGACLALQEAFRVGPGALLAASCLAVVGPLDPTLKPVLLAVAKPAYEPAVLPPERFSLDCQFYLIMCRPQIIDIPICFHFELSQ